jgi:hypothetical protein
LLDENFYLPHADPIYEDLEHISPSDWERKRSYLCDTIGFSVGAELSLLLSGE